MASGKVGDCGRIRKEKSKNGRFWDQGKTVRQKMNSGRGVGRLRADLQRKDQKWGEWGEGETVRKKLNAIGKCCGLRTEPQRKEQKWKVMG